ncbi:hypothetical protein [Actinophytocola algeriensis]|jgi:hypothetical protein|uniref:Uncharacterized protein n=1 Tax=Actinophytocola algeriensis TaxID=1768010 RepID=A0A7W7Q0I7_9PSEU|nr:hypothetical protein [Actinophytocola algeriensis]MBB4904747.1 hypothetical protein [Actinophytocola algeriensis]MBE1476394.1 hypothetical protein [Actinophytocola algeriensis]
MLRKSTRWWDVYRRDHEPSAALKTALGATAFASLLGTFFGDGTIDTVTFAVSIVCLVIGILLLLADRHGVRQERDTYLHRLNWYYEVLSKLGPEPLIVVDNWEQTVVIMPNGDTHEVQIIDAVAPREMVFFARLTARSRWRQPKRQLRRITMTARRVNADNSLGPSWHVMAAWEGDKLVAYIDLDPPLRRGETIRFQVERTWPAKCRPMMRDNKPEDFLLRTTSALEIKFVRYSVVLPEEFEAAYELIGEGEPDVQLIGDMTEQHGRKTYTWYAEKVPEYTWIGIRLQLK